MVWASLGGIAAAQPLESVWDGSSNVWSDASHWSTADYPDNGKGGFNYDAVINGGNVELDVDVTIESFSYDAFAADFTGAGNLTINDTFNWNNGYLKGSGLLTLASGSTANVTGGNVNVARDIVNHGSFEWSSGSRLLFKDASLTNQGTVDAQVDGGFLERNTSGSVADTFFDNAGTFTKSGGSGTTEISSMKFNNSGITDIQIGTLKHTGGGVSTGNFNIADGATLNFHDVYTFDPGTTFTGDGNLLITGGLQTYNTNVSIPNLDLTGGGGFDGTGNLTVTSTMDWSGGNEMSGSGTTTIASGAILNLANNNKGWERDFVNEGTTHWTGGRLLFRNATFQNNNTLNAQADGTLFERNSASNFGNNAVNNSGTLTKSAGGGTTTIKDLAFNNSGLVEIQTGTLAFTGNSEYTQTDGKLLLNGGDVTSSLIMDFQGGSIEGEGLIASSIQLADTALSPGQSLGTLDIDGNVSMLSGGEYVAELGALGASDLLNISGTMNLSGSGDKLSLTGGVLGETYTIASFTDRIGEFDSVSSGYEVAYLADAMQVSVVVPEPTTLLPLALIGIGYWSRRRRPSIDYRKWDRFFRDAGDRAGDNLINEPPDA